MKAQTNCDCKMLLKVDLDEIQDEFPVQAQNMMVIANQRLENGRFSKDIIESVVLLLHVRLMRLSLGLGLGLGLGLELELELE